MNYCCETEASRVGRRAFTKGVARALLGAFSITTLMRRETRGAGHTEALLLSCMDYRLIDETERYMASRGLRNKYDHIVLAGASLGAITDKFPAWNETFWTHLKVAIDLHSIREVIVLDHRDCGAYNVIFGEDLGKDRAKETMIHASQCNKLKHQIDERYPQIKSRAPSDRSERTSSKTLSRVGRRIGDEFPASPQAVSCLDNLSNVKFDQPLSARKLDLVRRVPDDLRLAGQLKSAT